MNGSIIDSVENFNFLGLVLSSNLNWNCHIDHISRKISRAIGVINALKSTFPLNILLSLYNTLILPHFNYCLLVWGAKTSLLFSLQKKTVRIITNSGYLAHTDVLFKQPNLLKIDDIYKLKVLKFYYKLKHDSLPFQFSSFVPNLSIASRNYGLRNPKFLIPTIKHEHAKTSFRYQLIKIVNGTTTDIIDRIGTHSLYGFSLYIKHTLLENYKHRCAIINCYACLNI